MTKQHNFDKLKPDYRTDELVAEAIGAVIAPPFSNWELDGKPIGHELIGPDCECHWEFAPSTDLNDAFWAAEQLFSKHKVRLQTTTRTQQAGMESLRCEAWFYREDSPMLIAESPANTIALAICKAILRLKNAPQD